MVKVGEKNSPLPDCQPLLSAVHCSTVKYNTIQHSTVHCRALKAVMNYKTDFISKINAVPAENHLIVV